MSNKKIAFELIEKVMQDNWTLMDLLSKMSPADQVIYLPKVEKIIKETHELLDTMTESNVQDIPEELYRSPKAN